MTCSISSDELHRIIGIPADTPLSLEGMCRRLRPRILPPPEPTPRLERFCQALAAGFEGLGIMPLSEEEACGRDGRFLSGTVVFSPGRFPDELLPINRVSTLYNNIIVGIYDEPPPLGDGSPVQERLDAIVGRLARDMVHILIYLTEESWTICTMNGGVVRMDGPLPERSQLLGTLVPKLTAQVVPPRAGDIEIRQEELDTSTPAFKLLAEEFTNCSRIWRKSGWLLSHTSTEGLDYRSAFYRRIVSRYLDQRSGMSYGFFAHQLPLERLSLDTGQPTAALWIGGREMVVPVPEVRVLTTRSGCRKGEIDGMRDLVEIGINKGRAWLKTPKGSPEGSDVKPSFDTLTILAHALGNAFAASIIGKLRPSWRFPERLASHGASMTHWHGYPGREELPEGYWLHGENNPPVSCSTPQSAAYSLAGKLEALERALETEREYLGDVHVEPNHGTNVVGALSLTETARRYNPPENPAAAQPSAAAASPQGHLP